jgi:hypothetical protein
LLLGGTAYVFIPRAEKGVATGVVARVKMVLTSGPSRETLGEFDLRGS